ncbi:MAG: hypothetical protein WAK33_12705, partial [Silvibacterium sp.]
MVSAWGCGRFWDAQRRRHRAGDAGDSPGPQSQRPIDIICGAAIVVARYGSVVQKPTLERFGTDPVNGTRGGERKLEPDSAFAPRSAQVLLIAGKDPRQW